MILACPPDPPLKSLLSITQHVSPDRPRVPDCAAAIKVPSSESLGDWNVDLLKLLLNRRRPTAAERMRMRDRIGPEYAYKGSKTYSTLKYALHAAHDDAGFRKIAIERRGMWLEFGVLTALSTNITSVYLEHLANASEYKLDGFDTFTGLPEAWPNGKGGFYYGKGTFSWAARGRGPTPPVRPNIALHRGLFNETLPPFLQSAAAAGRPLAWASIDCDLYGGTRDALFALGPRLCAGTRLHFHELLKDRYWKARSLEAGRLESLVPSEEARALYEWLRTMPGLELELLDVTAISNSDAAAFVVKKVPPGGPCP